MKFSRRMVLRGMAGATLGLPLLESFAPGEAEAQDEGTPSFFIAFRQANGVSCNRHHSDPERFWPDTNFGTDLNPDSLSGRALEELLEYREQLLVLGNVNLEGFDYGDGHANGAIQSLTARGPAPGTSAGNSQADGPSLDYVIGEQLNANGNEALYLYAGINSGWLGGACLSWRGSGAGNRRSAINDPLVAYETLTGGNTGDAEAAQRAALRRQSVNDLVRDQAQRLLAHPRLSKLDREKLEQHMASIRDLEVALSCNLDDNTEAALAGAAGTYDTNDGDQVLATARLHMQIAAIAVACGYTRSVLIQVGNGNDGNTRYYRPNGAQMENFHYLSHRIADHGATGPAIADADVMHHEVDRQFAQTFGYLLGLLRDQYQALEGGPLLDAGIALWFNDLGNGPPHSPRDAPYIIGGSCGGRLKQGQIIELEGGDFERTHDKLLNTLGAAVGVTNANGDPLDDFGDAGVRGNCPEILA